MRKKVPTKKGFCICTWSFKGICDYAEVKLYFVKTRFNIKVCPVFKDLLQN